MLKRNVGLRATPVVNTLNNPGIAGQSIRHDPILQLRAALGAKEAAFFMKEHGGIFLEQGMQFARHIANPDGQGGGVSDFRLAI